MELLGRELGTHWADFGIVEPNPNRTMPWSGRRLLSTRRSTTATSCSIASAPARPIGIQPCDPALTGERFVQQRVSLHHLCLRARSREDVDRCATLLKEIGAKIVRGPMEGTWAPG